MFGYRFGEFYLFHPLAMATQPRAVRLDRKSDVASIFEWPRTNQKLIEEVG